MTLTVRYMRTADISTVITIDRQSFDPPWSARSYTYEVNDSTYSHMMVLEHAVPEARKQGLRGWLGTFTASNVNTRALIAGYGGLWHFSEEAHISTIATDPLFRGRGWGELCLAAMIQRSITLRAEYVVLEVRVSNSVAQALYAKYAFETVNIKTKYYSNNGEDAYDMRLNLSAAYKSAFAEKYARLIAKYALNDQYTNTLPTRMQSLL
jgi:[ribosomal protein S18]-alanine N-acetyltransferase